MMVAFLIMLVCLFFMFKFVCYKLEHTEQDSKEAGHMPHLESLICHITFGELINLILIHTCGETYSDWFNMPTLHLIYLGRYRFNMMIIITT